VARRTPQAREATGRLEREAAHRFFGGPCGPLLAIVRTWVLFFHSIFFYFYFLRTRGFLSELRSHAGFYMKE
jgi:hypothetical protein